jgi:transcriptional regulator with XRE-family HTH domain
MSGLYIVVSNIHDSWNEGVTMTEDEQRSSRPERPEGFYELRRVVAANLRNHRQRRGWSLNRVADGLAPYLGQMGASTISSWENSRQDGAKGFTVEEMYAICRAFGIHLSDLLAPPSLLDMPPVERLPGEESHRELIELFEDGDRESLESWWGHYLYPDPAPF